MELAEAFYDMPHVSRQLGDCKNIMKIKHDNGDIEYKARIILYNSIEETHAMFMEEYGAMLQDRDVSMSPSTFLKAR